MLLAVRLSLLLTFAFLLVLEATSYSCLAYCMGCLNSFHLHCQCSGWIPDTEVLCLGAIHGCANHICVPLIASHCCRRHHHRRCISTGQLLLVLYVVLSSSDIIYFYFNKYLCTVHSAMYVLVGDAQQLMPSS